MKLVSSILGGIGLGVVASLFALGACGGDKSPPAGSGGNAAVGGGGELGGTGAGNASSSAGGSSSGGGTTSAGGSGPKVVPSALMTDFSEVADGTVVNTTNQSLSWGKTGLTGGTFLYQQATADAPTGTVTGGALNITAAIAGGDYSGFGFYFGPNSGSDACAYQGFSFTISGDLGGSTVDIQMQMTPDYPAGQAGKGSCEYGDASMWSYCKNPHVAMSSVLTGGVTSTSQTVQVPWTSLVDGNPTPDIDCHQLLGIQLQFNCPSTVTAGCNVNVTIDNLTFYPS